MDRQIWKDAGYNYDLDMRQAYRELIDKLDWDDNYELLPVGAPYTEHTERYGWEKRWLKESHGTVGDGSQISRRLKPGLEIAKVKEG